ncbi:MAG: hypothetical protein V4687_15395 [Bacteroidota bacterium]
MKKILLSAFFALTLCFAANAQEEDATVTDNPAEVKDTKVKSLDELKAERAALVALVKSEEFQKRLAKSEAAKAPKEAGIAGVDALTDIVSAMLNQLKENRNMIPQLYASVTGQTIDGAAATDLKPITPDQMVVFTKMFVEMGTTLVKSSKELVTLPGEIKSAGVMKGLKALKNVAYIKNAISSLRQEISYNSKMVKNLMDTNKLMAANTGSK